MAGPIKPKGRDYPLSATPEPVSGLTLKRANQLERRTPGQMDKDAENVYNKEVTPVTQIKRGSKLNGFQQDSVMNKAFEKRYFAYQASDAKQRKMDMPGIRAEDAEEKMQTKYKIPTKKKR